MMYYLYHVIGSHFMLRRGACGHCRCGQGCHPGAYYDGSYWSSAYPIMARALREARRWRLPVYMCEKCI